jgi:hypothetical protein
MQSPHSHLTIATTAAPIAITVRARSTIAGAYSDLLDAAIERVEARNSAVNAVVMPLYDYGRKAIEDGLGYQSYMMIFPETGQGIVVMTGSDNGTTLATALIHRAAAAYGWPPFGALPD